MRFVSATAVALVVAGAALAGAPAAQAATSVPAPCPNYVYKGPNLDDGYGVMRGSYNLKDIPYQSGCDVMRMRAGQVLYFHCWQKNRHGNLWVYGRVKGTRKMGWMSLANFRTVRDSTYPICNDNKDKDHT
ncbi:hypothetical protein ACFFR3_32725 [Nonomuraea salmonea]|uniref:SH3 domain-containing protein n=2 Tax=Nonomuraea salmonea TaxID=46181 RepID=A0ABV5NVH0_9ACTN